MAQISKKLLSIFFSSAHDGVHEDNIINAALAFNKQFNIKHWVVHYDVSLKTIFEFQMTLKQFLIQLTYTIIKIIIATHLLFRKMCR